ncbi:MAG: hypothetical protein UY26_C0003G0182 [Candidatus Jorgensenbacteria bacterium GW2011_GWA1_48_13]|uniref:Thioesterase superfamily protein n=2 Tax=Candidatus Joergenseniibacteriota TaxID=1752739 RepID=A0A0G1W8U2_9BACT|nr:MAG: hypothetical protein UY26_C0003G0182 [Candidatus Jorgensenbacteria bacterium GW2011_GWA1_48_13]KKU98880.1 MAG: hypothetical protein UY32_C0012G0009 [Candidatus Jorgensenbacteria bacterium GW2011_GWC1_48_8]KKW15138.1 MAG: hypothetical protein UY55_C0002G0196 [Candidatus Jorgensenbacteria bacterium GW2011_GWB1_50_10]
MKVVVDGSDIDEYCHKNYKAYPRLFEPAQDAFMNERGIGFAAIEQLFGLRSPVKLMEVAYHQELREGDEVEITTEVSVGNTSITYYQAATKDGVVAAEMKLVVVLTTSEGPARIPDEIRAKLK